MDFWVLDGRRNGTNSSKPARGKKSLELDLAREVRELTKDRTSKCCGGVGSSGEKADAIEVQRVQNNVEVRQFCNLRTSNADHGLAGIAKESVHWAVLEVRTPSEAQARLNVVMVVSACWDDVVP